MWATCAMLVSTPSSTSTRANQSLISPWHESPSSQVTPTSTQNSDGGAIPPTVIPGLHLFPQTNKKTASASLAMTSGLAEGPGADGVVPGMSAVEGTSDFVADDEATRERLRAQG